MRQKLGRNLHGIDARSAPPEQRIAP
jgi:hypothetical protein